MSFRRKNISRRDFIKYSVAAGAAAAIPWRVALAQAVTGPYGVGSPSLTKFVDPIRGLGGTGIPVAASDGIRKWGSTVAQHYTIGISQYNDVLHSDFLSPAKPAYIPGFQGTKLWGYGQGSVHRHLGGIIVAQRNVPVQITFQNNLPTFNIIPVDTTVPMPNGGLNRTAVHLHGGLVPWISDGGPHDWWDPKGGKGTSFLNNSVLNPGAAKNEAEYYYPNDQSARLVWYHDHAWGITRTNAYAGIASGYVITDPVAEAAFEAANPSVPSATSAIYLIFQDKIFIGPTGPPANYGANAGPGDLFYANTYDQALFGPPGTPSFGGSLLTPFPYPSCVPEFFGDTILVNGTAYPVLEVEARPVRFRMLNACNARFLNPRLVKTAGKTFPDNTEPGSKFPGRFIQIGTEGGYLPFPVPVSGLLLSPLLLAPAERADLVCDFTDFAAGSEFILYSDAPGPYPGGAGIFDYYPKNPDTPTSIPGFGPNTRTLLKIRIKAPVGHVKPFNPLIRLNIPGLNEDPLVNQIPFIPMPIPKRVKVGEKWFPVTVRTLTLNEGFDQYGRLQQFLGPDTEAPGVTPGFFGRAYLDVPTENVAAGSVEVWQLANLTSDTHPIHFHLVNVQILYRQAIQTDGITGTFTINPTAHPQAPDLNELGYKETVRMNPGEVTTVIMKFDLPKVPFKIPASPRTGGHEYVYHCHILEHEEHDMMRPLIVT
jgi:spore coat protein A